MSPAPFGFSDSIIDSDPNEMPVPQSVVPERASQGNAVGLLFHSTGSCGAILERRDRSCHAYRWLYSALHTLDLPVLAAHPPLRSALIGILCDCGFVFSVTGGVIGWRRLRRQVSV